MDLSVIVPCYNLEHDILNLLDSFEHQIIHNYEIEYIFVCDSCTDNSVQVIDEWSNKNNLNCTILIANCRSCAESRNLGFEIAEGDYIWFVDGDDWLARSDAFFNIITQMRGHSYGVLRLPYISKTYPRYCSATIWQYCFDHRVIQDMKFVHGTCGEDRRFMNEIFKVYPPYDIPVLDGAAYYYYNFGRPGSITQLINEERNNECNKT